MADFEKRLARLEEIGTTLRDGSVPIDRAASLFEEGVKLAKQLDTELRAIERRIEILVSDSGDPEATPTLELFPDLTDSTGTRAGSETE